MGNDLEKEKLFPFLEEDGVHSNDKGCTCDRCITKNAHGK